MRQTLLLLSFSILVLTSCQKTETIDSNISARPGGGNGGGSTVNLTQGLVAFFPFNGNANDASGNGNNGTVYGATLTTDRFGRKNRAYSFNGINNQIVVPSSSILNFGINPSFSINFWINKASINNGGVISKGEPFNGYGWKGWNYFNDDFQVGYPCVNNPYSISTGVWKQITFIINSGTVETYIDGSLASQYYCDMLLSSSISTTSDLTIGVDRDGNNFFSGKIDDVRIYSRALTQAEISYLTKN